MFFQLFCHSTHIAGAKGPMQSFAISIYSGEVVSKDVMRSFHNLLQGGDRTSAKKGGNVDLSKLSKDDFRTGLIPDYIDCRYLARKPMTTNKFGLRFAVKEKFY